MSVCSAGERKLLATYNQLDYAIIDAFSFEHTMVTGVSEAAGRTIAVGKPRL